MVEMVPLKVRNGLCVGISVQLPKTNLLAIAAPRGYVMCGLVDLKRLDDLHREREIVGARVTGVRSLRDLLDATVDAATEAARSLGVTEGMTGEEALNLMF